jgi:CxxC motif-containing protein (DUF1111 family)
LTIQPKSSSNKRAAALLRGLLVLAGSGVVFAATDDERARIAQITQPTSDFSRAEAYEINAGGAATSHKPVNLSAFSHPSANMPFERQLDFRVGDGIFRKLWVSAPSSTTASDGLGPLFNARSCQSCHLKDGRGRPPAPGEDAVSMFLRVSIPPQSAQDRDALESLRQAVIPDPIYGTQLQNYSVQGLAAEGRMHIDHSEIATRLADGEVVRLRKPIYSARDLQYGPLHAQAMLSARVAPPMIGMGLLETVDETDILAWADPDDVDGNGISGRPNRVWSAEQRHPLLGRFGWKAGEPSIAQQSAHAFSGDIGISSPLVVDPWGDCTESQPVCRAAPHGISQENAFEVTPDMFELLVFYARNLAVPARRKVENARVLEGKRLFYQSGCAGCHRPKYVTRRDPALAEQSHQLIWPYTDLLLHDMGEGLADDRPEGLASGREWRTPPLWGIGLTETVSGHTFFLHDGRARNLLEAILWHGGEAQAAKQRVVSMPKAEREALLAFLNSL